MSPTTTHSSTDVGWSTNARALRWAAIGGLVAALVIGIPMHAMGMMVMGPAGLVGSDSVWVGWVVHLLAGLLFGSGYALFFRATDYGRAAGYGALYGLVIGVVFAWLALFTILDMPLFSTSGAMDVMMHVLWGVVVGLVTAWGLRRGSESGARRRQTAGV